MTRVVGTYSGEKGNLLVVTGAMHGNEPAGVLALQEVFRLLAAEKDKNPNFVFYGKMVGMVGNSRAYAKKVRYIDSDFNRLWLPERVDEIMATPPEKLLWSEEKELWELYTEIKQLVADYKPEKLYLLDLHTTTAHGGIFTVTNPDEKSEAIGLTLFAPVITEFTSILKGTLMQYFNGSFGGVPTVSLTFESGQHDDPESVVNAVSAIINTLRAVDMVAEQDVEAKHDTRLRERAEQLPKKAKLIYRHPIHIEDNFKMKEGYRNFQAVKQKEVLAYDRKGAVVAPADGLILMPLYQKLGDDGFFLVEEIV